MTNTITLIKSRITDARLFYKARFNPEAIAVSLDKSIITYEKHHKWYISNYLNGFYTIILNNEPVGYIRVDDKNVISISILPMYKNKGIGTLSLLQLIYMYKGKQLAAKVFEANIVSINLFKKFPEIELIILKEGDILDVKTH